MIIIKREFYILLRIVASFLTAGCLVFFFSSLAGEDLIRNNDIIDKISSLFDQIGHEIGGGIDQRIKQLGEVPEKNPFKKFYGIELAKEIHEVSQLTEKQKIMFDSYNVRSFEIQLKRIIEFTEASNIQNLMDELEVVKRELKNSANLLDKQRNKLIRQRTAYIVLFFVLWVGLYLYYSRGIIFKRAYAA